MDEDQEFIAPDNGGWHYTIMRDWIAVCPDIGPTAARLYWIIRSIMHEKGERARRLSYDQLCYLLPGVNGKPTGETRVKDALRELEAVGLISNPDGDVVRRWVIDPKTGKQRKDNFRRWKIHDYPTDSYAGWRSAIAKLDAYTEDWREHLSTEGRNSDSQTAGTRTTSNNGSSSQRSTESRNSDPSRRNSDSPRRNSGEIKSMTSNNGTTNNPSKESLQPTNAREGTTGAGWLAGKEPEQEGVAGRTGSSDAHPQSELQDQALSLLNALVMPHGPQYQPQAKDVEHVVAALQAEVPEKRIHEAIVSGIAGAERPAATVKRRCSGLWKLAGSSRRESESQGQAELVRPEWCGSCEDIDRTYFNAEGQLVQCPRCHPSIAGWVERVPA